MAATIADHPDFASRMLPVTAKPPQEMYLLTDGDVQQVRGLLGSKRHRQAEALALLRTLVVSEEEDERFGLVARHAGLARRITRRLRPSPSSPSVACARPCSRGAAVASATRPASFASRTSRSARPL